MKLKRSLFKNKGILLFVVVMLFITIFQNTTTVKAETMDQLSMPLSTFEILTKDITGTETQFYKIKIVKEGALRLQVDNFHGSIDFYSLDGSDILSKEQSYTKYDKQIHFKTGTYYIRLTGNGYYDNETYTITTSFTPDKKTTTEITITLKPGKGIQLGSVISPKEKTVWKASKSNVATVSNLGYVKAKKVGTCYIYAIAKNSGATDRIKIIVKK